MIEMMTLTIIYRLNNQTHPWSTAHLHTQYHSSLIRRNETGQITNGENKYKNTRVDHVWRTEEFCLHCTMCICYQFLTATKWSIHVKRRQDKRSNFEVLFQNTQVGQCQGQRQVTILFVVTPRHKNTPYSLLAYDTRDTARMVKSFLSPGKDHSRSQLVVRKKY